MNYYFNTLTPKHATADPLELTSLGKSFCCDFTFAKYSEYKDVYEPSEDTFLLIDAIHVEHKLIAERQPKKVLEVG
jgi:methylase of polypeptide subunit release factors